MRPAVLAGIGVVVIGGLVLLLRQGGGGGMVAGAGIDKLLAQLPAGTTATHGAVSFDPVAGTAAIEKLVVTRDGQTVFSADSVKAAGIAGFSTSAPPRRIGHITLTNVSAGQVYRHIGKVEIDGLAPATLQEIFDPAAYPNGKPAWTEQRPVIDRLEITDVDGHQDVPPDQRGTAHITGIDIHAEHSVLTGLTARQFHAPHPADFNDPDFIADVVTAFTEATSKSENTSIIAHGLGSMTIATAAADGYANGKLDVEEASGITLTAERAQGGATLAHIAAKQLDFSKLMAQLPAIMAAQKAHTPPPSLNGLMTLATFELTGLDADFHQAPKVTLAALTSHSEADAGGARKTTAQMQDLAVLFTGRDVPPNVSASLQRFGMQDFYIDQTSEITQDTATGHVALTRNDIALRGLGTLSTTFTLDNWKSGGGTPQEIQANLRAATVIGAQLTWQDASLTGRLFHIAAQQSGKTESDLRQSVDRPLMMLGMFMPEQPDASAQIDKFLDGRHQISITVAPATPVTIGALIDAPPQQKASLLGLKISGS